MNLDLILRAHFTAPASPKVSFGFQRAMGGLIFLAALSALDEQRARLSLWALGRALPSALVPYFLFGLLAACGLLMTLGLKTRALGFLSVLAMVSVNLILPFGYHNNHYLLALLVSLVSLGSLWPDTLWTPRMIQLQLATVYLFSAVVKLCHPWWSGSGRVLLWAVDHHPPASTGWVNDLARELLARPYIAPWMDLGVTATEAALPFALFSLRFRWLGLAVAVALHITMQEWLFPQMFTFLMLLGLHSFGPLRVPAFRVQYNPDQALDRFLSRVYPPMDWFARTAWSPGASLSLKSPDAPALSGADTLRALVLLSPVSVLAYAAFALCPPEHHRVENTLATLGFLALAPIALRAPRGAVSLPH